jgi:hypothetical protein
MHVVSTLSFSLSYNITQWHTWAVLGKIFTLLDIFLFVGFLGFYDGLSCFTLNEEPIYVGKHFLKLAKALTMKMTPFIDQ